MKNQNLRHNNGDFIDNRTQYSAIIWQFITYFRIVIIKISAQFLGSGPLEPLAFVLATSNNVHDVVF